VRLDRDLGVASGEALAPVPVGGRSAAIQQPSPRQQQRPGTHRAHPPGARRDLAHPPHCLRTRAILLDRTATGDQQRVDLSAHVAEAPVSAHAQSAIRYERGAPRAADDLDAIDGSAIRIGRGQLRRAGEDLERSDQIEHFRPRRGDDQHTARAPGAHQARPRALFAPLSRPHHYISGRR